MTTITNALRNTVRTILTESREYDASTMRIARDGTVTALKDADKTFDGPETLRYTVGHVDEMVDTQGARREGW